MIDFRLSCVKAIKLQIFLLLSYFSSYPTPLKVMGIFIYRVMLMKNLEDEHTKQSND